ncbi:hypothetical protein [Paraburkholderia tropica]|uniref:hypothetical protein n=1 Tax=Paraburkholderia tropica TaxID=92647 RepID=UPI002AB7EBD3|nr:hypothetical protein [Paraburkholderia tropica]
MSYLRFFGISGGENVSISNFHALLPEKRRMKIRRFFIGFSLRAARKGLVDAIGIDRLQRARFGADWRQIAFL